MSKRTELSEAYNALRNAAWGRGTTPLVPTPLALEVDNLVNQFRAWVADAPLVVSSSVYRDWLRRHAQMSARVAAAGRPVGGPALPDADAPLFPGVSTALGVAASLPGIILAVGALWLVAEVTRR